MMFSFRLYFLPVLLFLGTLGCSKPTQEGKKNDSKQEPKPVPVALKSFLPQPPPGWELQQEPQEETIADAGTRAWAAYGPKEAQSPAKLRAVVYILCRTDIKEGETLDSVFQSGAFQKLIQPAKSEAMFFKVIATNLAAVVYLFYGQRSQTTEQKKQLMALFTDQIDHQELAKAFPPGPAQAAKEAGLYLKRVLPK